MKHVFLLPLYVVAVISAVGVFGILMPIALMVAVLRENRELSRNQDRK